ncbi:MAG: arsenate reductase ArsC [Acidimicrobiales bacterium]
MRDPTVVSESERGGLHRAAIDLHDHYAGVFGLETIEQLLVSTAEDMAACSTVYNQFRLVLFERMAGERLQALAKSQGTIGQGLPGVLFLCVHNAGRSQMALGWFAKLAGSRAFAWSGGSEPTDSLNPTAVASMAEIGIDISSGYSKPWTAEVLDAADVVITMGCGDACPLYPGKKYEDWDVDDPTDRTLEEVRAIRDQIGLRVLDLLGELEIAPDLSGLENWTSRRRVTS